MADQRWHNMLKKPEYPASGAPNQRFDCGTLLGCVLRHDYEIA
jgi:hypothetical protein